VAPSAGAPGSPAPVDAESDARMQELYRLHAQPVYQILVGLTLGDQPAARDLLQETMLRAWKNLDRLDPDLRLLRPWLVTVARRLAIDASRTRRTRPLPVNGVDLDTVADEGGAIDRMLTAEVVRRALPRLGAEHRTVLYHLYLHGRSVSETAALLGIPEGTVKSRTFYALRSMRALIGSTSGA
jgi:RNA polymerase sigma-70 factor (ECF subfamily)